MAAKKNPIKKIEKKPEKLVITGEIDFNAKSESKFYVNGKRVKLGFICFEKPDDKDKALVSSYWGGVNAITGFYLTIHKVDAFFSTIKRNIKDFTEG